MPGHHNSCPGSRPGSRRRRRALALGLATTIVVAAAAPSVQAQEAQGESVRGSPRPEYDPSGVEFDLLLQSTLAALGLGPPPDPEAPSGPLSSFNVLPALGLDVSTSDNVFRTPSDRKTDTTTTIQPSVRLRSDWTSHALNFDFSGRLQRNRTYKSEDVNAWSVGSDGLLEVDEDLQLNALVGYQEDQESRGTINDPGATESPTQTWAYTARLGLQYAVPESIQASPSYAFRRNRYGDDGSVSNRDRWFDSHSLTMRLGYELQPGTVAFIQPSVELRRYVEAVDRSGLIRDMNTYDAGAGLQWDTSSVTFVDIQVGLRRQVFEDPVFRDSTSRLINGTALWNALPLVTLRANVGTSFTPSTSATFSGTQDYTFSFGADWEAMYNLLLSANWNVRQENFLGEDPPHDRTSHTLSLAGDLLINEYLTGGVEYAYTFRSGTLETDRLTENLWRLKLSGRI
ncbi:MAG: outer membrane beta-barrel protein [Alphaproteobacteria bacterium]